jgi:glycogen debranching enzyme
MSVKLSVGPLQLAISSGYVVLVTDPDGQIRAPGRKGLFFFDTRLVSSWRIYADGTEWDLQNAGSIAAYASRVFLVNRAIPTEFGEIAPHTLSLVLGRSVGPGLHEDIDVTNYGQKQARFNLEIAIRGDFADIFEVRSGHVVRRGRIRSTWSAEHESLRLTYRNRDFLRQITVSTDNPRGKASYANGRLTFELCVAPGQSWHACLLSDLDDGNEAYPAPANCIDRAHTSELEQRRREWRQTVLKLHSTNADFDGAFDQAVDDMAALRLPIPGTSHREFVPGAGVPWFMTAFGRDSLIASLQNMLIHPEFASGTLDVLGSLQARARDDFRDAEPGKIPHEIRHGELAHFNLIPHTPYYGTADATPLYLILLHAAWRRSGERALLEAHLETAERCLEWIERYGDRDGDGFQEYQTRSSAGYENQGWKDSGEAILYPDGSEVKGPKAVCELQGYVYDAWVRMAEIFDALERPDRAEALRRKARQLFRRFNEAFWNEEDGFYALALDGDKNQVRSVASNPGHCLWSGIVPAGRAQKVVERLMQPDMWSGWGVRTLSANHPAYNPHSYQNGSVWPHDNGIIALGFRRYGFAQETCRIAGAIIDASGYFVLQQLPELYAGIEKTGINFPVQYLGANVPQAWAAGSVFFLLQAILGADPDAQHGVLYVDPVLPEWLTVVTLRDLRLGGSSLDLEFRREAGETCVSVLRGDARSVVRRPFDWRARNGEDIAAAPVGEP